MGKWISGLAVLVLAASVAGANDGDGDHDPARPTSGTYYKGPAIGGRDIPTKTGLLIFNEKAVGTMSGEPFTGAVDYVIEREKVNFVKEDGAFSAVMHIKKSNGDKIDVHLDGKTTGLDPSTSPTCLVGGTWRVMSGTGRYAGLRGDGTFSGVEFFATGVTNGTFSGTVHEK